MAGALGYDKFAEVLVSEFPGIEKIIDLCHSTILQDLTDAEQSQFVDLLRKVRNRTEISFTKRKKQ